LAAIMREGRPAVTARRVAAYRLGFERLADDFGDPLADERLAADAAGAEMFELDERMLRYLRARTSFFDRVVLKAIERGVTQLLVVGAGYDGRSLRYARAGVRWFEVDHPDTQSDKRARLDRLDIGTGHIAFVGADLRDGGLARALLAAGFEADAPAQIICEGVAVYLYPAVLEVLLTELRAVATPGTRLALSTSVSLPAGDQGARERFAASVAAAGEPTRNTLTTQSVEELLNGARWRTVEVSERAKRLGFVVTAPIWRPALPPAPPTKSKIGSYMDRTFHRNGTDTLAGHLQTTYGVSVERLHRLDVGVYRAQLSDGRRWVARISAASRPLDVTRGETEILRILAEADFPAERCAQPDPVSIHQDQAVVVTEHVDGEARPAAQATFRILGDLLGRLHALAPRPELMTPPGGAWHHLAVGTPADEITAAVSLLDDAALRVPAGRRACFGALRAALVGADGCGDLPHALIHPDFVPANALATASGGTVILDWAGTGWGPRLYSLGFLLWAAGRHSPRSVDAAIAGYRPHIEPRPEEMDRLAGAILARPLILDSWSFSTGREPLDDVAGRLASSTADATAIAARARTAFHAPPRPRPEH
jgi:methyltransferase (TIGR00027 family)